MSGLVACRRRLSALVARIIRWVLRGRDRSRFVATGRGKSRHVGVGRDRSHFLDVSNMLIDGCGRDQIFFSVRRFDFAAIEMPFCAIPLNRTWGTRKAGTGVSLQSFVNGKSEIGVG